jgi:hypothetical protein
MALICTSEQDAITKPHQMLADYPDGNVRILIAVRKTLWDENRVDVEDLTHHNMFLSEIGS